MLKRFYPEIEPYDQGFLDVGDGHVMYYSQAGNKKGIPVVHFHGGPGSCSKPKHARYFNPRKYRIILFDQRGCGKSTPRNTTRKNTTPHLVADIEKLRKHLGVSKWVVFGGSWGSALALAYAAKHAKNALAFILFGVFLGRRSEIESCFGANGVGAQIFPDAYQDFLKPLSKTERKNPVASYHRIITGSKTPRQKKAVRAWCAWETSLYLMGSSTKQQLKADLDAMEKAGSLHTTALMEISYFKHDCYIDARKVLSALKKLGNVPAFIFQGRVDFVCPPQTAWDVHTAWPKSKLTFIEGEGHSNSSPGMLDALIRATDAIAGKFAKK